MKPEVKIKNLLSGSAKTLCAAESCTGGMISHLITTVPGSSAYYLGSVTTYSPALKTKLLGVRPETISDCGIVSSQVAREMAEGARKLTGATYSVSITGWADTSGDEHEPAGTAWIAVSGPNCTKSFRITADHPLAPIPEGKSYRENNIEHFAKLALDILVDFIENERM